MGAVLGGTDTNGGLPKGWVRRDAQVSEIFAFLSNIIRTKGFQFIYSAVTAALQSSEIAEKILFWGQVRWKERLLFRLWRIGPAERPVLGACSRTSDGSTNTHCDHLPGEDASALLGTADVNNAALLGQSSPKTVLRRPDLTPPPD